MPCLAGLKGKLKLFTTEPIGSHWRSLGGLSLIAGVDKVCGSHPNAGERAMWSGHSFGMVQTSWSQNHFDQLSGSGSREPFSQCLRVRVAIDTGLDQGL